MTDLVLREFGLLSASYERDEVCFLKHLHGAYTGVEIYSF